jgi:hypothetical protein
MHRHKVPSVPTRPGIPLRFMEAALALLLCTAALSVRDLPLVDLPQHALQLANWLRIEAGDASVAELELNFRTPYLLAYPVARALASVVSVLLALKLVLVASVVLQAVTLRKLCEALGHDAWLGLLGFPLGLGYSFCFGFVSFCAALPLVNLTFLLVARHRDRPSTKTGLALGGTLALLLVAHGVALAFTLLVLGPLLLSGSGKLWQRTVPALAPVLLGVLWLVPGGSSTRLGGDLMRFEPERWLELPGQLVGIGSADWAATLGGLLLLLALGLSLGRTRKYVLLSPLLIALLGYAFFPTMFRGSGPLGPRFTVFLVPALLLAFSARDRVPGLELIARRALALLVVWGVVLLFCFRLRPFNRETAEFHELVRPLPAGLELRPIVFERAGHAFPGIPSHLHVPAYYSVEKGGDPGYTFAMYSISVVRLRAGAKIKMWGGAEWAPERFQAAREAADYDYFVVRSSADPTESLFGGPRPAASLDRHVGSWWGYRRSSWPPE